MTMTLPILDSFVEHYKKAIARNGVWVQTGIKEQGGKVITTWSTWYGPEAVASILAKLSPEDADYVEKQAKKVRV